MGWRPPGKDCGLCGARTCEGFLAAVERGEKRLQECPFYHEGGTADGRGAAVHTGRDVLGNTYDFLLTPLPGEPSARKVVLPFRPDLVERWGIDAGDIVLGRPEGAGCPVQHVLRVIDADPITGLLTTHVVGPAHSRGKECLDVKAYHIVGFEGMARTVLRPPTFGMRQRFLPSACMMALTHTGVVNLVIGRGEEAQVRVEDIRL
ncbi:(Fe-S)-binding protein [Methanofollis fontis]|uniref:Fe-S cluster protein n=1 Tax=Methanofollis fontis TaxID=2052832 RepID=A0A483CWK6_9EURY|nr:(Fe-S)-binding protein [Methanofollis fontis]TAJ45590.1 Fe-S cluster protein [Methanofollis fontis]